MSIFVLMIFFPNPSDSKTLIPFLDKILTLNLNIKNIVADAGMKVSVIMNI